MPKNIIPLPSGRYRVRIRRGGRLYTSTWPTLEQARQYRDLIDADHKSRKHGMGGILRRSRRLLDLIEGFLRSKEGAVSDDSLCYYYATLAGPSKWIREVLRQPELRADELDDRLVADYTAWRTTKKLSPRSVKVASGVQVSKDLAILRQVYIYAREEPRWRRPKLPRNKGGKRIIPLEKLADFLEAMPRGSRERTFAELAVWTGIRTGDLRRLTVESLRWEDPSINFVPRKTGRRLIVPLTRSLVEHLRAWLASPERVDSVGGLVFTDRRGRELSRHALRGEFRRASIEAGIEPPVESIGLARNALIAGLLRVAPTPYAVQRWAGHASIQTTMGYVLADSAPDELRDLAARLERLQAELEEKRR